MAAFETWMHTDLTHMVEVKDLSGVLFSKDTGGNQIGVEVTHEGYPVNLSGTVRGFVILCDGTTKNLIGSRSGNRAWITLTNECYDVPGPVSIVIKIETTTIGACTGTIKRSMTDTIIR